MRLKNSWWIQSAVKLFPSCVHRSSCIILMVTAVCFQEWQSSLWGFGGGEGSAQLQHSNLHRAVRDHWHNVCAAQWRWSTACPVKGIITMISELFQCRLRDSLTGIHERFTPEWLGKEPGALFKGIWVTFSGCAAVHRFFESEKGGIRIHSPILAEWEKKEEKKKSPGCIRAFVTSTHILVV